jgi:hypothetical protein
MHLNEGIHAIVQGRRLDLFHLPVVQSRDDDKDCICAKASRLGHLPWIDDEVLAEAGQGNRRSRRNQIGVRPLKVGLVGEDREARSAALLIGTGMRGWIKVLPDQTLGG